MAPFRVKPECAGRAHRFDGSPIGAKRDAGCAVFVPAFASSFSRWFLHVSRSC
jgi:hypothetical protein